MKDLIPPGSTLGVFGGGQLGRMFALAAREMGFGVQVFTPEPDTPAGSVADRTYTAGYTDVDAVQAFAREVDVVTFEFENVPAQTIEAAARHTPVRPGARVLHIAQHRVREKTTLREAGLPVTPFLPVRSREELLEAVRQLGTPAVLKTAAWGYDGKGQIMLRRPEQAQDAWNHLQSDELILEQAIDFECELSVVAARGLNGEIVCYDPIENVHRHHILDVSLYPARVSRQVHEQALEITRELMAALDVVGVLCVEFFLAPGATLLINEIAPRPHNSGHLTIDACVTSQFEQQVRAICGLPLGSTRLHRPTAMINLLGDLWSEGPPRWAHALALPDVKLHLYGKDRALPGRKMGHLTAPGDDVNAAAQRVKQAYAALTSALA